MDKAMRRRFMADSDVVPSKQPWWKVTGHEWPLPAPKEAITRALATNRYAKDAQAAVWAAEEVRANTPAPILDNVEVWERDGRVVMVTSHIYEGQAKLEAATEWARANGIGLVVSPPSASWINNDPATGCTLFNFMRG